MDLNKHRKDLLRKAEFMTSNEMDAQDLVQETFVRALTSKHQYREEGKMFSWLLKIMENLNLDLNRRGEGIVLDLNDEKFQRLVSDRELPAVPSTKLALS